MGFWSRIFAPPAAVVADVKALAASSDSALALRDAPPAPTQPVEFASLIQPGSQMWRTYPEESITPTALRTMQKDADLGFVWRLMELFDAIATDYHVAAQLRTRKLSVAGAPLTFESGDGSARGAKIAEEAQKFWDAIPNRTQLLVDVLDDVFRGFSCVRPIWDSIDGKWQIVGHEAVESRYFRFLNGTDPIITPTPGAGDGVPIPPGYIYSEFRDKAGAVVRAGVGRSVAKLWVHKGFALVDTASYIEKYGSPHVQVQTGRTMREGDPELERIKDAARSFISDQIGLMPAGATLEVLDAVNKGANVRDVYLAYMSFLEMGISKAINGQTLTSDAGPGGIGHGGAAEEHGDVRQDLKEFDAERAGPGVVRLQIIKPWTLYHFGPTAPVPKVCINVAKPEDKVKSTLAQKQRAETINILRSSGLPISKSDMYEEFDLEEPDTNDDKLEAPPQPTNNVGDPAKGVPDPAAKPAPAPAP